MLLLSGVRSIMRGMKLKTILVSGAAIAVAGGLAFGGFALADQGAYVAPTDSTTPTPTVDPVPTPTVSETPVALTDPSPAPAVSDPAPSVAPAPEPWISPNPVPPDGEVVTGNPPVAPTGPIDNAPPPPPNPVPMDLPKTP